MKNNSFSNFTFGKLTGDWLFFNRNSLKKSTLQTYEYLVDKHIMWSSLAGRLAEEITSEELVCYADRLLAQGLSPKTINCVLLIINSVFKFAKTMYGINPPYINYVKDMKRETRVLSVCEQKRLESLIREKLDSYNLGVLFALYTGVRIGELCALRWSDLSDGAVRISKTMHRLRDENGKSVVMIDKPKTPSSNRTIPLPDFLNKTVESRRGADGEFFLANERLSTVEPRIMQNHFKKLCARCGLENATFHTLRHTFATRCIECGFDPKTLSEILGHSDVKTTLNRYVHSSLELKKNSMNLLTKIAG